MIVVVSIKFNTNGARRQIFNSFIFNSKVECKTNYFNQAALPFNDIIYGQLHKIPPSDISLLKYPYLVIKNKI